MGFDADIIGWMRIYLCTSSWPYSSDEWMNGRPGYLSLSLNKFLSKGIRSRKYIPVGQSLWQTAPLTAVLVHLESDDPPHRDKGSNLKSVNCWIYTYIEIPCSHIYEIADTYTRQFPALKLKTWFFLTNWYPKSLFCESYLENPTRWCWDWLEKRQIDGRFCGRLRSAAVSWECICDCNYVYVNAICRDICVFWAINRINYI